MEHLPVKHKVLATCGEDGTFRLWNYLTNTLVAKLSCKALFTSLACIPDGKAVAVGSDKGFLRIIDISDVNKPVIKYCKRILKSKILNVNIYLLC